MYLGNSGKQEVGKTRSGNLFLSEILKNKIKIDFKEFECNVISKDIEEFLQKPFEEFYKFKEECENISFYKSSISTSTNIYYFIELHEGGKQFIFGYHPTK